ncbi:MAG: aspartate kinase [Vicingaceae bacterium]
MKVFKFGGASIVDADSFQNLLDIVTLNVGYELIIVVSAMGKTTNALEKLTSDFYYSDRDINSMVRKVKKYHNEIANELFPDPDHKVHKDLRIIYDRIKNKCILLKRDEAVYDFLYDQVVSEGEMLSSCLVSHYLNEKGIYNILLDASKLIKTNNNYRDASVNWKASTEEIRKAALFQENSAYVTQGFIGSCEQGHSTTLGREGSDFSAAVFAHALDATEVVIWKDVPGLLNADPKYFSNTVKLDNISYHEAVELAYYGASVIHPKTIKPLQNKAIPLFVKSFKAPGEAGSVINETSDDDSLLPSYIFKTDQVLLSVTTRDYSFISEKNLGELFNTFAKLNLKIDLMENSAISFSACFKYDEYKLEALVKALNKNYKVLYNKGLELMTVRHYDQATLDQLVLNKEILVEQKSRHTARMVMKNKA